MEIKKFYNFELGGIIPGVKMKGLIRVEEIFKDNDDQEYVSGPAFLYWPSVQPEQIRLYENYMLSSNTLIGQFRDHDAKILIKYLTGGYLNHIVGDNADKASSGLSIFR